MAMTKKEKQIKRRERYGKVKISPKTKVAWLSEENRNGWSLGLALGKKTVWLKNTRFTTREQVADMVAGNSLVFVPLKSK